MTGHGQRRGRARPPALVAVVALVVAGIVALSSPPAQAALPTGFVSSTVVSNLASPTSMAFAPDGRIFVAEQAGKVRVVKNGAVLATPFVNLSVNSQGERGVIGVAVDPSFATRPYVYVYYTAATPTVHNRVSRFPVNGDVAGSEEVLLDLGTLMSVYHNAGALQFGTDGKLYIGVGDNGRHSLVQETSALWGKVLRINPDGSIPTDNPFYATAAGVNRSIWAMGLRNPFTTAFQPGTGRFYINDVGNNIAEEINEGSPGANYGWPTTEGPTTDPRFTPPIYSYLHSADSPECAVTGGAFYNPATPRFPSQYLGRYFFADFCAGWIRTLNPTTKAVADFATDMGKVVDLDVSADGGLYMLVRDRGYVTTGLIRQIAFPTGAAPTITQQPADVTVAAGQPATFEVSATGNPPLAYQWQRNGVNIPGATGETYRIASAAAADDGAQFRARVTNSAGTVTSAAATLHVLDSAPPQAVIVSPAQGTTYRGGDTIQFSGTGTDPEDGALGAAAFTWEVAFHHDDHFHPFILPHSGVTSGSFTIPTDGETSDNVWYRIHLSVTDSDGLVHRTFRDILPVKATVTLDTEPSGLSVTLDGQPLLTPYTFTGVVGIVRELDAPSPQVASGATYEFDSWSDGGAASHTISTPAGGGTFVARYRPTTTGATCFGRPVTHTGEGEIFGTSGDDVIMGSSFRDIIHGLGGNDALCGGDGFDTFHPGAGDDSVDGGNGNDGVNYTGSATGVTVDLSAGQATGEGTDTVTGVEQIVGSAFADRLTGDAAVNAIWAAGGDDVVDGLGGDDQLNGGSGRDTLFGREGNDTINGGADSDGCSQGPGTGVLTACERDAEEPPPGDDTIPPGSSVSVPAKDQTFTTRPITFSGSATDNVAVAAVRIGIKNRATGLWWRADGTWGAYQGHAATLAAPGSPSTGWTYQWAPPPGARGYGISVTATDAAGNADPAPRPWVPFSVTGG